MFTQFIHQIQRQAEQVRKEMGSRVVRASVDVESASAEIMGFCGETDGITELATMLIVAGLITVCGAAAAVAISGGINNTVNTILTKL